MTDTNEATGAENGSGKALEREYISLDPNDLRSLQSFEDAVAFATEQYGAVVDAATEIGDGFILCDDKDRLIDVPMMMLGWRFTPGDYGAEFVVIRAFLKNAITVAGEDTNKVVIIDGGTGINAQIKDYMDRTNRSGGMLVSRGLRKSEYDNEYGHGTTHYLNV